MNNKAEFTLQSMIIAIATIVFVAGAFTYFITTSPYDNSDYDPDKLGFISSETSSLKVDLETVSSQVDSVVVDKNVFDYFAGIFNAITKPFKTVYQYFRSFRSIAEASVDVLMFSDIVKDFVIVLITTLVVIGLIIVKYYSGRDKNS